MRSTRMSLEVYCRLASIIIINPPSAQGDAGHRTEREADVSIVKLEKSEQRKPGRRRDAEEASRRHQQHPTLDTLKMHISPHCCHDSARAIARDPQGSSIIAPPQVTRSNYAAPRLTDAVRHAHQCGGAESAPHRRAKLLAERRVSFQLGRTRATCRDAPHSSRSGDRARSEPQ